MQENLMQENVCYGLIQTMVNAQESGRALAMSDHDQRSCELPDKSCYIIRHHISSTSKEDIQLSTKKMTYSQTKQQQ